LDEGDEGLIVDFLLCFGGGGGGGGGTFFFGTGLAFGFNQLIGIPSLVVVGFVCIFFLTNKEEEVDFTIATFFVAYLGGGGGGGLALFLLNRD
jgi:hypothetical protein